VVYGHSSGGWTSLWLQLQWPEVFGACWTSAPDPVAFSAFQMTNLYADANLFEYASGMETPSYRRVDLEGRDVVRMTVRQEAAMERAIHPLGGSGQQWDAWEAMFSPCDPATGLPRPMFDAVTGAIDREVVEHWSQFDIARVIVKDWAKYGPIMTERVHLNCGIIDSFYLNRAVERLKEIVEAKAQATGMLGEGYILLVEHGTHGNVVALTTERMHREMIQYFRENGLHE
jgi:hypothetical protein